ncbi:Rieske (2Fe-2S) protein [Sphingobium aromaticiconvertens]|uniref:Rieske (2Fe-2S) protein n=1 Tax=Sphingobium aromaticiconvertens TaxID=365341 RepID=UPI00301A52B1
MSLAQDLWWAVARSEEVTSKKPLSVDIGNQPVVLWRDNQGIARALEDRCPHRRAPLSLGCIRDNGLIQCGYHGWSYDGESGRLKEIPNMKDQQKFPPIYKAQAFGVSEQGGFVRVCLNPKAQAPLSAEPKYTYCGTVNVSLTHQEYLNALYDDPSLVIAIRGVRFSPYLMSELHEEDGMLVMERNCQWNPVHWPSHFVAEFPLTLLTRTHPLTGETQLTLRDDQFNDLLHAALSPVPSARGVTAVRWRAELGVRHPGLRGAMLRGINPLSLLSSVDGSRLRTAKPTVSLHGEDLRNSMLDTPQPADGQTVAA